MELRDLWRILLRRQRVVYWTFGIVAFVSLGMTAFGLFNSYNETVMSLEVNQAAPSPAELAQQVRNLNSIPWDPIEQSLDRSVAVVNNAFTATDRRSFFDTMHTLLKQNYGIDKTWQQIQGMLDIYPAARNHIYFKITGALGDENLDRDLVVTAAAWVENYVNKTYPLLYPDQPPPHAQLFDPVNLQKAAHITKALSGLVTRFLTGLALGLVLAFVWEYLAEYAQDERDVERLLGTRALAVIPIHEIPRGRVA
jgi:hypothetical protein